MPFTQRRQAYGLFFRPVLNWSADHTGQVALAVLDGAAMRDSGGRVADGVRDVHVAPSLVRVRTSDGAIRHTGGVTGTGMTNNAFSDSDDDEGGGAGGATAAADDATWHVTDCLAHIGRGFAGLPMVASGMDDPDEGEATGGGGDGGDGDGGDGGVDVGVGARGVRVRV